jgi:hypothetical protein
VFHDPERDLQPEPRARTRRRLDPELSTQEVHEAARNGQPQTGAAFACRLLALLKGLEQSSLQPGRNAGSGIDDLESDKAQG